jgi:Na+-transporting NADH:ubiquinone oxidoreductase subunit B
VAAVVFACGVATEWLFERKKSGKVSEAVLVTCALYALAFPPKTPLWIIGVGIIFAVGLGKGVYGGFGRNIFNPAITGRAFVYISFAVVLSASYTSFGAFGTTAADVVASATPLGLMRAGRQVELSSLLFGPSLRGDGRRHGASRGRGGDLPHRHQNRQLRIMLASAAPPRLSRGPLLRRRPQSPSHGKPPAGSFLFVTVFMATDPVSAPKKPKAHYVYGALIGATVVIIRTFSASPKHQLRYSFGNTFAILIDMAFDNSKKPAAKATGDTQ